MKKIIITIAAITYLIIFSLVSAQATSLSDCNTAIDSLRSEGLLKIKIDRGTAMSFIEPLLWKQMTHAQKVGMMDCIKNAYGAKMVYIIKMGSNGNYKDMYAKWESPSKFKLYR